MGLIISMIGWLLVYQVIKGIWKTAHPKKYLEEDLNLPSDEWYY